MRDMIELAIERESELLDEVLEFPEMPELPSFPARSYRSRIHPGARKFAARGISVKHFNTGSSAPTSYAN